MPIPKAGGRYYCGGCPRGTTTGLGGRGPMRCLWSRYTGAHRKGENMKGEREFKRKPYPFTVGGLSVGDVGITKAEAEGKVYNLKKLEDFNGTYVSAAAAATVGVGAGATAMKNDKGVVIHLFPKTKGVSLKLAGEGVKFTLEK